jgi:hypothetical protein
VVRIASPTGGLLEGMDYGPFSERRGYSDPRNLPLVPQATNRGFNGHEMLDGLDVVHINGRIYDSRRLAPRDGAAESAPPHRWIRLAEPSGRRRVSARRRRPAPSTRRSAG